MILEGEVTHFEQGSDLENTRVVISGERPVGSGTYPFTIELNIKPPQNTDSDLLGFRNLLRVTIEEV
jgi:hypothetical protein